MKKLIKIAAITSMIGLPVVSFASNTIIFNGEVTNQTCEVNVEGFADPVVLLDSVPTSKLTGGAGKFTGETPFTIQLSGCTAPTGSSQTFTTLFQATNPTASGNLTNTAKPGATGVSLQVLTAPGGTAINLSGGKAVAAGNIVLAVGQTSATYQYAVQYFAERATVAPGPVLGALTYTVRYE